MLTRARWNCQECNQLNEQSIPVRDLNFGEDQAAHRGVDDLFIEITCDHCQTVYSGGCHIADGGTQFYIRDPHEFSFPGGPPEMEEE